MQDAGRRTQDGGSERNNVEMLQIVGEGSSDQIKLLKVFCDRAGGRP